MILKRIIDWIKGLFRRIPNQEVISKEEAQQIIREKNRKYLQKYSGKRRYVKTPIDLKKI